jgi:hypothetical protein
MHTSTSPQYAIIASCDVAAAMMEAARRHRRWWRRASRRRWTSAAPCARSTRSSARTGGSRSGARTSWRPRASARADWMLKANDKWHGFGALADGFNMLDPIKCTLITPGLDLSGKFAKTGIPASIVTKFLAEHGVVVEKTGPVLVLHHVHDRHHQGPLEHAADRAAAVQGRLRPQRAAVAHPAGVLRRASQATSAWACATCARPSTRCTPRATSRG